MSTLQEMLSFGGGSFQRAEQICLDFIVKGHPELYLDLALLLHAQGKVEGARQAGEKYAKLFPDCPRGKLSASWFKFYDGDLKAGFDHFEYSRQVGTLKNYAMEGPRWNGEDLNGKTIILLSEGGFGDQVLGLRNGPWLKAKGANVVAAISRPMMELAAAAKGIDSVVDDVARASVKFDYWTPAFSAFRHCCSSWETLYPGHYMKEVGDGHLWDRLIERNGKPNIGLRWKGNPKYEHEQFRVFPVELLWGAIGGVDANFYSLQKDDHSCVLPPYVHDLDQFLGTWEQTAHAIARMDLVVTSCTAIAHLAAAMGKETWVVVPVMCYWPWAKQGDTSPWYPTVKLFRQTEFGKWEKPFEDVGMFLRGFEHSYTWPGRALAEGTAVEAKETACAQGS